MPLLDTLAGGGLAFTGALAGQMYAARREAARDRAAAGDRLRDMERTLLLDLQHVVSDLMRFSLLVKAGAAKREDTMLWAAALGQVQAIASRLRDDGLRTQVLEAAALAATAAPADVAGELGPVCGRLIAELGQRVRRLDDEAATQTRAPAERPVKVARRGLVLQLARRPKG